MKNTIILTVHNKGNTIKKILDNLFSNISKLTTKVIIILDGCTDNTSTIVNEFFKVNKHLVESNIIITNDIWETKANNIGLKEVLTEYATIVQDDMLIKQKNWDKKLLMNFKKYNLFAVSGRAAHNFSLNNNQFKAIDVFGREYPLSNKNIIGKFLGKLISILKPYWIYKYLNFSSTRLIVNRGPLVLNMKKVKELNFFDEKFAPFELDDADLCCRAFKKFGLLSLANPIFYTEINGSKNNNYLSKLMSKKSIEKNTKILIDRHNDLAI